MRMRHTVICPDLPHFPHYLLNGMTFEKQHVIEYKMGFDFL
jgi:hypothetical protein